MTEWVEASASVDWVQPREEYEGATMGAGEYGLTFGEVCVYGTPEAVGMFVDRVLATWKAIENKAAGPLVLEDFDPDNDYACPRCDWSCPNFGNLGELVHEVNEHIASHLSLASEKDDD